MSNFIVKNDTPFHDVSIFDRVAEQLKSAYDEILAAIILEMQSLLQKPIWFLFFVKLHIEQIKSRLFNAKSLAPILLTLAEQLECNQLVLSKCYVLYYRVIIKHDISSIFVYLCRINSLYNPLLSSNLSSIYDKSLQFSRKAKTNIRTK